MKHVIGSHQIYTKKCTISSMDWAKKEIENVPHGTLFLADSYAVARGRQGRFWNLYPGQLICTFVLKPHISQKSIDRFLTYLNMALSCAVAEVLQAYGVGIKWPNDFVAVKPFGKKVGGILLEGVWKNNSLNAVIVGIALNCNNIISQKDDIFPIATSLRDLVKKDISVSLLFKELIASLNKWYVLWEENKFDVIYLFWKKYQLYLGKTITIHKKDASFISGIVQDVTRDGDILILDNNKKMEKIALYSISYMY